MSEAAGNKKRRKVRCMCSDCKKRNITRLVSASTIFRHRLNERKEKAEEKGGEEDGESGGNFEAWDDDGGADGNNFAQGNEKYTSNDESLYTRGVGINDVQHVSEAARELSTLKRVGGISDKVFDELFAVLHEHNLLRRETGHVLPKITSFRVKRLASMQVRIIV